MKKMRLIMVVLASAILAACQSNSPELKGDIVANPNLPNDSTPIPVAYFSWGGTTQRMAQEIATLTGAELFRIEPETPYSTEYTPTTEVARAEKEADARPAIKTLPADCEQILSRTPTFRLGCPLMIVCN